MRAPKPFAGPQVCARLTTGRAAFEAQLVDSGAVVASADTENVETTVSKDQALICHPDIHEPVYGSCKKRLTVSSRRKIWIANDKPLMINEDNSE
ncbi:hypothetical protein EVAR_67802_1 [Eumeta japonica]|uniref:Uncharacterized protein n=1 Tax=Eumeta variegata TaxID=151549 RepID=A0A4C1ZZ26_EUMVA|nr:hypothetical protein EVAR_67802_1 [Eumeta japonica]